MARFFNPDYDASTVSAVLFNGQKVPPDKVREADEATGKLTFYVCDKQGRFLFDPIRRDTKIHTVQGTVQIQFKERP